MRKLALLSAMLFVSLTCVACIQEEEHPDGGPPVSIETGECPNQSDVMVVTKMIDEAFAVDVDGDGAVDDIEIHEDDDGPDGCKYFLAIQSDQDGDVASEPIFKIGVQGGLEAPQINSVVQIDGEPGLEIVVDEMSGASTQFVGAFTVVEGALERIEPPEGSADIWSGAADGLFPYGGSVGHIEGADCTDDGGIVVSAALPAGPSAETYVVVRRLFDIDGADLTLRDTERHQASAQEVFDDFSEFRASPFGSCPDR